MYSSILGQVWRCTAGAKRMALRIKSEGAPKSTRQWSCSTLHDGVDMLLSEAQQVDAEEESLLLLIQDPNNKCFGLVTICSTNL